MPKTSAAEVEVGAEERRREGEGEEGKEGSGAGSERQPNGKRRALLSSMTAATVVIGVEHSASSSPLTNR